MTSLDVDGRSPLFFASVNGHFNALATLLDMGFDDLDAKDNRGDTALHACASKGHKPCLNLLLENAADPDVVNQQVGVHVRQPRQSK